MSLNIKRTELKIFIVDLKCISFAFLKALMASALSYKNILIGRRGVRRIGADSQAQLRFDSDFLNIQCSIRADENIDIII